MRHSPFYCGSPASTSCVAEPKPPTILTIDDDPNVSQALKRHLSRYRVALLQAYHGTHGIWLATTQEPDVIVTDLRMPQGRGQDVVAYLLRHPRTCRIPIIVLTGLLDEDLRRRMVNLGVVEYFIKPVCFEELCRAIRRFVDLVETEQVEDEVDGEETLFPAITVSTRL